MPLRLVALMLVSCAGSGTTSVGAEAPRVLEVLDPPGAQIGLRYGEAVDLRARYRLSDAEDTPLGDASLRFAIFDDPGGSTLSTDRAVTSSDGVAQVRLTAGMQERSFRVRVTTADAQEAEFGVTVSKLAFVHVGVQMSWPEAARLRAGLHNDLRCAELPPQKTPARSFRTLSVPGASGIASFQNLLSGNYAVSGRAEDPAGRLLSYGCVDLAAALIPPGSSSSMTLPLALVRPSMPAGFEVSTTLTIAKPAVDQTMAPWKALTTCPRAPAQELLDVTADGVSTALKSAIGSKRGLADAMGCRPDTAGGMPSLDAQLQTLLMTAGAPARELSNIVTDLGGYVASASVRSRLVISPAGAQAFAAAHALETIAFTAGGSGFDVAQAGLPVVAVKNVRAQYDGQMLGVGAHGFTLGLGGFWKRALEDQSIALRLPSVMPRTTLGLISAVVGAVVRSGKTGCAAVEDLVCAVTLAPSCAGAVQPACATGIDILAARLNAGFAITPGVDLTLEGAATAADADGDLVVDTLGGAWTASLASSAPFTATAVNP